MGQSPFICVKPQHHKAESDLVVNQAVEEVDHDDLAFKIHNKWSKMSLDTSCTESDHDLSTKRRRSHFVEKKYLESLELENDDGCHCEVDPWMLMGPRLLRGFSVNLGKTADHWQDGDVDSTDFIVPRRISKSHAGGEFLQDHLEDHRNLRRCNSLPANLMHRRGDDIHLRKGAPWTKAQTPRIKGPCLSPGDLRLVWEGNDGSPIVSHTHGMITDNQAFKDERERALYGLKQDEMFPDGGGPCAQCQKGRKGHSMKEPNQDNFSTTYTKDGWGIACVADGHGEHGHFSSTRAVQTVPYHLVQSKFWPMDMRSALKEAFEKAENELISAAARECCDIQSSGSTFVCLVWKGSKVWTANLGDSRLIVSNIKHGEIIFETKDHKVEERQERRRLEAAGCEVKTTRYRDGHKVSRVFRRGYEYPGLCMSRTFGDISVKKLGITAEPDVHAIDVDIGEHPFALLASDGVWDFLPSKKVMEVVIKALEGEGLESAVSTIIQDAHELWKKAEGDLYCDDITAVLIPLHVTPNLKNCQSAVEPKLCGL